ncbi:MAG: hypothetical protein JF625_23640 [Inquilinus limosus]|uniref:Uncharacterized protein n=1 Tax=Inquilinus limosus TaxID=171674 RepID=A0A952KN00_9PROT|nr:hypothetical protein [Inquilinus limosus]
MDIADNKEFWLHLEHRISREFSASRDNSIRFLWVDGFVPGSIEPQLDRNRVLASAWVEGDRRMNYICRVTLLLDAVAAEAFRSNDWRKLVPAEDVHGWLSVDKAASHITVTYG